MHAAFGMIELCDLQERTTMLLLSKDPATRTGRHDYPDIVHSVLASLMVMRRAGTALRKTFTLTLSVVFRPGHFQRGQDSPARKIRWQM
jgi:hypothetical protein